MFVDFLNCLQCTNAGRERCSAASSKTATLCNSVAFFRRPVTDFLDVFPFLKRHFSSTFHLPCCRIFQSFRALIQKTSFWNVWVASFAHFVVLCADGLKLFRGTGLIPLQTLHPPPGGLGHSVDVPERSRFLQHKHTEPIPAQSAYAHIYAYAHTAQTRPHGSDRGINTHCTSRWNFIVWILQHSDSFYSYLSLFVFTKRRQM